MRKSAQLKQRRDQDLAAAQAIADLDSITDDQRTEFDARMASVKQLEGDIARHEALEAATASNSVDVQASPKRPTPIQIEDRPKIAPRLRAGKLRFFKGANAEEEAYAAGQWALATLWGNKQSQRWCASNGIPMIQNAASEGDNTKGGFLVPDVMERTIIDLREDYGVFRQIVKITPMSSDYVSVPRRQSGLTAYAVGEGATFTDTTKLWSQVNLTARKWGVLSLYSSEIADDAVISIAEDLANEIAYAFAVAEDGAGFNGDGSSTYHGITGVVTKFNNQVSGGASTYAGALDAASGHDTFAEIDATDLVNLTAKLPKYALGRAAWICSQPAWSTVFQRLQAASGGNTVMDVAGKMQYQYLGYPVIISQSMPTATTDLSDTVMLLFGDAYSAITMGTRRGITLATSSERYFESDQVAIRGTERFDINVHDIGDTSTAGPLVALIGE